MKLAEVKVGSQYTAKISNCIVRVTVLRIVKNSSGRTRVFIRNERTGRELMFRSASRLRRAL